MLLEWPKPGVLFPLTCALRNECKKTHSLVGLSGGERGYNIFYVVIWEAIETKIKFIVEIYMNITRPDAYVLHLLGPFEKTSAANRGDDE